MWHYYRTRAGMLETLTIDVWNRGEDGTRHALDGRTEAEILTSYNPASVREIINLLTTKSKSPSVTVTQICDELGINRSSVHKALARLQIKTRTIRSGTVGKPNATVSWTDFIKVMEAYDHPIDPVMGSGSLHVASPDKLEGTKEQVVYCPSCGHAMGSGLPNQVESKPK
jgi:hypothetical protein